MDPTPATGSPTNIECTIESMIVFRDLIGLLSKLFEFAALTFEFDQSKNAGKIIIMEMNPNKTVLAKVIVRLDQIKFSPESKTKCVKHVNLKEFHLELSKLSKTNADDESPSDLPLQILTKSSNFKLIVKSIGLNNEREIPLYDKPHYELPLPTVTFRYKVSITCDDFCRTLDYFDRAAKENIQQVEISVSLNQITFRAKQYTNTLVENGQRPIQPIDPITNKYELEHFLKLYPVHKITDSIDIFVKEDFHLCLLIRTPISTMFMFISPLAETEHSDSEHSETENPNEETSETENPDDETPLTEDPDIAN